MKVVQAFKNLVHKKRFWIIAGVVVVCALVVWAYKAGWRITYAPELETSWECVSAIASVASAVGTVAAVWFAIRVPKKIAEEQNRIELFEKRYQVYNALFKFNILAHAILEYSQTSEQAINFFDAFSSSGISFGMKIKSTDKEKREERQKVFDSLFIESQKIGLIFQDISPEIQNSVGTVLICVQMIINTSINVCFAKKAVRNKDLKNLDLAIRKMENQVQLDSIK